VTQFPLFGVASKTGERYETRTEGWRWKARYFPSIARRIAGTSS